MIKTVAIIGMSIIAVIMAYAVIRIVSYAIFKSYYQAKEEYNGKETDACEEIETLGKETSEKKCWKNIDRGSFCHKAEDETEVKGKAEGRSRGTS